MNKRKLALLISKHPLLRKLTEDKTIPNSAVARLIVEELMEAQTGLLKSALGGIRRDFRVGKQGKYIDAETENPVYPYGKLSELEEEEQAKYKNAVNKKVQAFLAQQNPKTKAKGEELENQIDTVIDKEIGIPQGTEQKDDSFNSLDIPKYGNIIELALKEYENIPIEELDSLQKLTVALTHRYFDNRAMTEQVEPKKIFLGTLGRMVGATEALPSKTYEDFKTFLDYADKQNSDRLQKNSPSKYYQPPEKGRLFDVLINIMKDLSVRAKVQQYITETKSFQSDKEQPKTAKEPESQPKTSEIIKQMADELIVNNVDIDWDQDDLDNVVNLVLQGVELEPEVEEEIQTAPTGQQEEIIAAIENEVEKQTSEKPVEQPQGDTDNPEVFDPEAEDLETLITTSKALIDEFYDKDFLQEQGILINAVLKQLAKIVEKEEQEKAARRSKKPEQAGQDLQEQDQEPFNEKERTKIQIDLKSFLRLIKKAKAVLKKFDDLRNKGSIASSGYKKDFIKILVQLQGNIKTLVEDLTPYMNLTEAVEKSDLQKKWDAIEVGYEEATKYLSNIIQAGTETQENFDMENNVKGAYGALMSITGYFPSVNPFGAKTTSGFDEYENNFNEAVDEVKGTIRDILEVTKGTIGRTATQNAIQGLKTFSGQIQNIFGEEAKSTFSDVVIKPNAPAAETGEAPAAQEPTTQPDAERRADDSKTIPIHRKAEEHLKEKGIPEDIIEKIIDLSDEAIEEFKKQNLDQTEIIEKATEKVMSELDPEEKTIVSAKLSTDEERREPTEILLKSMQDDSDTLMKEKNLEQVLDSKIEKLQGEFSEEERRYTDAYAQAIFKFFLNKNKIGNKDNPKYKSDFLVRARNQADAANQSLQETENNIIGKLSLSAEDQKEIRALLPKEQQEWLQNYRKKTSATKYFDYNKEEFGELVLLMLDRKILKHFEAEDSLQPSPTSTLSIQDTFGLTSEEMEAMEKFKKHLSSLKEQLEMTDSDREKYTKYLNSLSEEDTKHFSSAMRKIGSSKKQSVFRNWLGFDEPEETKTYKAQQSVDDSEVDSDDLGTFVIERASEIEDEDLSDEEKVKSIITAASEEFPLSNITDEDIEEIQQAFTDKDDSFKNQSLFAKLKDLITNDEYIKKLELAKAREVKDGILEAETIVDIMILDKKLTALSKSPLRRKIVNLFGKKFVELSNRYLRKPNRKSNRNKEILNYIAYNETTPNLIDGYDEVVPKALKQLKKFENANIQEQLANKLKPLIKEMLIKGNKK